jgi:hypothetical protein
VIGVVSGSDLLAKLALGIEDDATVPGLITGILHQHPGADRIAGRVPYLAELDGPGVPTLRSRLQATAA